MLINDLSARIQPYAHLLKEATSRVIDSGWFVLGPEVKRFEQAFASYLGTDHCIALANGTDAIELALRALGVTEGDCVATVANAGMYTTTAVLAIGAKPFFMDVDVNTRNATLAEVEKSLAAGVKAVVVTHLYGLATPDIRNIAARCKQAGVALLEDCAQAHGARLQGQQVGTFGDAASFSFYPTKNLGALGDGGAVATAKAEVAEKVKTLRQYGWTSKYQVSFSGASNSRLDELQAAMLSVFLPDLDNMNAQRRRVAELYNEKIKHPLIEKPNCTGPSYVAHLYVIRSMQRNQLRKHLGTLGIAAEVHYPIPDHRQPVFGSAYATLVLPNTEALANEILTLPCYPEMNDLQIQQVIDAVNAWQP